MNNSLRAEESRTARRLPDNQYISEFRTEVQYREQGRMAAKKADGKEIEKPIVAKTAVDLQRLKLMKLMKNPDKVILLPERPRSKNTPTVPEFVRNVMGSSAGAGSGEFHVYRHLRRKEYSRQKFIQEKGKKELLDDEYHKKLEQNKEVANQATAKRRAKRLKRKQNQKLNKKFKPTNPENSRSDRSNTSEEDSGTDSFSEAKDDESVGVGYLDDETANVPKLESDKYHGTENSENKRNSDD